MAGMASVFIVEDSPVIRAVLVRMLRTIEGVRVVGEAGSPADAIKGIDATRPDFVIVDIELIGGSGLEVLHAVKFHMPQVAFIVLTNHAAPAFRDLCQEAGARWFFEKEEMPRVQEVLEFTKRSKLASRTGNSASGRVLPILQ